MPSELPVLNSHSAAFPYSAYCQDYRVPMVQFYDFDEYKYNPPAKPDQKHLDWDYLGFPEFKRRAAILKDDTETSRQPSWYRWYEEHRARRIRENEAMMESLGLT